MGSTGSNCSAVQASAGLCPTIGTTVTDDAVLLEGTRDIPGYQNANPDGNADDETDAPAEAPPIRDPFIITQVPVTLADIAAFRPESAVDTVEPDGWTVVGLDTNFYASGGVRIVEGELLGQSASVRFTPVGWNWSYGDGTSLSSGTPGASWASSGIREFEPTPTSHVYDRRGTYTVDLEVEYSAEYRFAGGNWVDISGVLGLPANQLVVTVGSAKTVLVEHDCASNAGGPGC